MTSSLISRFQAGATAAELIAEGFPPSTVYQTRTLFTGVQALTANNRTPDAIIAEIRVLRVPPHSLSLQQIADRTNVSIRTAHNAVRDLPIPPQDYSRHNLWTETKDEYLRLHYRTDERDSLVAALGHPWPSIVNRASRLGLRRDRPKPRPRAKRPPIMASPPPPPPSAFHSIDEYIAANGVTLIAPVGHPSLADLPPMRWDRRARKATRRPI